MLDDIWTGRSVFITSFWGWTPDTWGTLGFTSPGRRDTVVSQTTDPFICVVYVTKSAPNAGVDVRGKVTGFYLVSHETGHRDEFTAPVHHQRNAGQWVYSLRAVRAFSFLPEYRLPIEALDPTINDRARAVATFGEDLGGAEVARLQALPFVEVSVFGGPDFTVGEIFVPMEQRSPSRVKAGPVNRSGYLVDGEPLDTPKELYALELRGEVSTFLGTAEADLRIFKIGLSISPKIRLEAFRKALPRGRFNWELHRSTRGDGHDPYPSFDAAVAGEDAMKDYLGNRGEERWLGGEFYAATEEELEMAWTHGREAAIAHWSSGERGLSRTEVLEEGPAV